ncbi:MAG: hypothetical protein HOH58_06075 [Opitutaceae bacterium]|jgi:hypothetical protein|nr:hypothetical protein [Opitutaceae bacterium]
MSKSKSPEPAESDAVAFRSLRFGWWALGISLCLGLGLEVLHGFKIGWYLDVGNEMRRLMFPLAHTHGTLLALVNIAAGVSAKVFGAGILPARAASAVRLAAILMPLGFLLGGIVIYDGDPGLGVLLVPLGGFLLVYGVAAIAIAVNRSRA